MNSRKHPSDLSKKQLNRRLAFSVESFQRGVEDQLTKPRKSCKTDKKEQKQSNFGSLPVSDESQYSSIDNFQSNRLNFDSLFNHLSNSDLDGDTDKILEDFALPVPEESADNPIDEINNILNPKLNSNDPSIDYFDMILKLKYDNDEALDSDVEDNNFFDELSSLAKQDPKYIFMNSIRVLCIDYIHTIPHTFIGKLLEILKEETGYPFPKDPRTFLKTPRESVVMTMGDGQYCHYGIRSAIYTFLTTYKQENIDVDNISLIANIDGAKFADSSADGTWIITVSETKLSLVEVIGIYKGEHKPEDSNELTHMFVQELTDLINNGILFENKTYAVKFHCLVCDAPAKSYVLKTKQHNGYYSCSKCTIKGVHENHRIFFPKYQQEGAVLRTDEKFVNQEYEYNPDLDRHDQYQIGETIMKKIPGFRPITGVVLDYMHLICLGIMLKLIVLWTQAPKCVLSDYEREKVSERLSKFKEYMPSDFSRNPRNINNAKRLWKAHELRTFLLYTGPIVLYKILPKHLYLHFLSLHVAITILVNPLLCKNGEYLDFAEKLLLVFVESFGEYYGQSNVGHNFHNIIHLVEDTRQFGCLDDFSAFKYENHIRKVKQLIRKGDKVLQQISNRLMEIKAANEYRDGTDDSIEEKKSSEVLERGSLKIDCRNKKDKYLLLDNGRYLECHSFNESSDGQKYVEGRLFKTFQNFYESPLKSDILNINVIGPSNTSKPTQIFPLRSVVAKICTLPFDDKFVAVPLIHTYNQINV